MPIICVFGWFNLYTANVENKVSS